MTFYELENEWNNLSDTAMSRKWESVIAFLKSIDDEDTRYFIIEMLSELESDDTFGTEGARLTN